MAYKTVIRDGREYRVKLRLKKKPVVILLIIAIMFTAGSYAWFVSTNTDDSDTLTSGRVAVTMNNTLHTAQIVLPGADIEGTISIANTSDVNIYLRVKISVDTESFYSGTDTFDTIFDIALGTDWVKKGDWYYYKGLLASGNNVSDIITSFSIRGSVGNEYQSKSFSITATSDAIQGTTDALDETWILSGDILATDKTELNY